MVFISKYITQSTVIKLSWRVKRERMGGKNKLALLKKYIQFHPGFKLLINYINVIMFEHYFDKCFFSGYMYIYKASVDRF